MKPEDTYYDDYSTPLTTSELKEEMEELENRILDLENELFSIRNSMVTRGSLNFMFIGFLVYYIWGDNVWEFLKGVFFVIAALVVGLFERFF